LEEYRPVLACGSFSLFPYNSMYMRFDCCSFLI
jgi:hypothetical protein